MSDWNIKQGESLIIDSTITNLDGSPHDITGGELTFKVYLSPSKPDFTEDNPVVITGTSQIVSAEDGAVTSYLFSTDTAGMDFSVLYYEVVLTEADDTVTVLESGKLTIGVL